MNEAFLYKKLLDNMYEGIYYVDNQRKITFWNKGAERISGFSASEVVNHSCFDNLLNHVDDFGNKLCLAGCPLHATLQDGGPREAQVYLHHKEGHRVAVKVRVTPIYEEEVIVGAVEMFIGLEDDFHTNYELEELKMLAYRDALTGLANRRLLDNQLDLAKEVAQRLHSQFGVAIIDIDFFKKVNDTYGHSIGDDVLKMVAKSMETGLKKTDLLGRWGGEEFVCLLRGVDERTLQVVAERLRMLVENSSLRLDIGEVKVTISIGATRYIPGDTIDDMMARADRLLYESKQNGRNRVTFG